MDYPGEFRYRSAAIRHKDKVYFFGGSNETYNYNGISYAEKKPVEPNSTILIYSIASGKFELVNSEHRVMDLRNIAEVNDKFYSVGGIEQKQRVSNKIHKLKIQ